jgi:hypothetical protein
LGHNRRNTYFSVSIFAAYTFDSYLQGKRACGWLRSPSLDVTATNVVHMLDADLEGFTLAFEAGWRAVLKASQMTAIHYPES